MHCKRCKTTMVSTHIKEFEHSRQEWFDCPVCGLVQFITEPLNPKLKAWLDSLDERHNTVKMHPGHR